MCTLIRRIVFGFCVAVLSVSIAPGQRPVRDWVRDGVIYEIYPRAFSQPGNFNAITARLDDLKDLGVTILWLMPIHPIGQEKKKGTIGSPYAVRDYYAINPDYGTADDLKRLVREVHKRGLKIIIDIVANHTAWDSVLMKHPEFYKKDANGNVISPVPDWADVAGLVPTDFWESARPELTKIKPDIVMIAEANKPELLLKAFELDYAWPFHT